MTPKSIPSVVELSKIISCDPTLGIIYWMPRNEAEWPGYPTKYIKWWNERMAGKAVAYSSTVYGGRRVRLFGSEYYVHRIIWKMTNGDEPPQIDHIDGDRGNNAITNLRASDYFANMRNKAAYKNNKAGHANIQKRRNKWSVRFKVCGKNITVGSFSSLEDAISARDSAKLRLGFHTNHGRVNHK